MRSYLTDLVGNDALRARLGDELARGALSHAYILEGPAGCGKHTLARAIACALACEDRKGADTPLPCGVCATCRKILAGNSPDVITVTREEDRATMGVDVIRTLRADVSTLPNDLPFKIYLIEDAHTMTIQAQNAFLLTLEEPPSFVIFLLLCEDASVLLETVRSRAPILRMQPLSDELMRTYLLSPARPAIARTARTLDETAPDEFAALLRMANGRIGRALELLEEKRRAPLLSRRRDAARVCELFGSGTGTAELLSLLYSFGAVREDLITRFTTIGEALRDLLALTVSDEAPLVFFTDREAAQDLAARFTTARVLALIAETDKTVEALNASANTRLAITHYLCRTLR